MKNWYQKLLNLFKKKKAISISTSDFDASGSISIKSAPPMLVGAQNPFWNTSSTITTSSIVGGTTFSFPATPSFQIMSSTPSSIVTLYDNSKEIVRLNKDGTVTWSEEINIDAAAKAFSTSLSLGTEICAGITERVRLQLRDRVFSEIIAISRDKGFLTTEDLTYMLEASKIIEKLKGINDK